jgi:hypothetical protein
LNRGKGEGFPVGLMVCRGLSLSFVVPALRALQQRPVVMPGGLDPDSHPNIRPASLGCRSLCPDPVVFGRNAAKILAACARRSNGPVTGQLNNNL